jgi:large subunit ribosomal protein L9
MKLILTQEVAGLGAPGDVVEVKDGYGRNYLVPRGFAMGWTRGAEKQIVTIKRAREVRDVRDLGHAQEIKGQLEKLTVKVPARAGAGGRLFGSVTLADVVAAVKASGGPDIDKRRIELPGQIKTVGSHAVTVRLHPEVAARIALDVVAS